MVRFRFEHPTDRTKVGYAGVDHHLGFFAEIHHGRKVINFDGVDQFKAPMEAILLWFAEAEAGFYTRDELYEALVLLQDSGRIPARLKLVVRVVNELKFAADGSP